MTTHHPVGNGSSSVIVTDSTAEAAAIVATQIADCVRANPSANLGLATGSTPVPVYETLVRWVKKDSLSLRSVQTFNLDEYIGLDHGHPQSYRHYMRQHLFEAAGIASEQTHFPVLDKDVMRRGGALQDDSDAARIAAIRFEREITDGGGIDLQLLGIGVNGHIAFNEPGSDRDSRTRRVRLTESTVQANARFFEGDTQRVPTEAMTMGIGTILEAKRIVILATGRSKAPAIAAALLREPHSDCPASFLSEHPHVTWVLDPPAAFDWRNEVRPSDLPVPSGD